MAAKNGGESDRKNFMSLLLTFDVRESERGERERERERVREEREERGERELNELVRRI